jgi:hypothetical protein
MFKVHTKVESEKLICSQLKASKALSTATTVLNSSKHSVSNLKNKSLNISRKNRD